MDAPGPPHPRPTVRRLRPVAVAVAVAVFAAVPALAACGTEPAGLAVPVLWASQSGGATRGGVENVRVSVVDGDGDFTVDLDSEAAQGAGPQWLAASASAAVVGALASAADPSSLDIGFAITGPIDGPSGGAALTVGVLAAIRGLQLRDSVTMTGTISPDGSVGRVGLVPAKVRAAADAGYRTVLVPVANATDRDPQSGLDVVALGASLGIEVRPVADLGAAMAAFTGSPVTAGPAGVTRPSPAVAELAATQAVAMVGRLDAAIDAASDAASGGPAARATPTVVARAAELAAVGRAALDAGDTARAYGAAVEGLLGVARASASAATLEAAAGGGVAAVRAAVVADAGAVAAAADGALARWAADDAAEGAGRAGPVARLSVPAAMGWLTYARAAAGASGSAAESVLGADQLAALAGTVAEQRVAVEVMWPDALAITAAVAEPAGAPPVDPDRLLDGYTVLLATASEANARYLESVLAAAGQPVGPGDPVVVAAGILADLATTGGPAVVRASAALSWWFVSSSAVAGRQAFGLERFGLGTDIGIPANPGTLDAAVRNAADTVTAAAGTLVQRGIDPSAPVWSAAWGRAAADVDADTADVAGEVVALGELWYSAVTALWLLSASAPGG